MLTNKPTNIATNSETIPHSIDDIAARAINNFFFHFSL